MTGNLKRVLAIVVGLVLVVSACRGSDDDAGGDEVDGNDGIRIAIVAPSDERDMASTQSLVDGVKALEGVASWEITSGALEGEEAADAIRRYAESDFDLVIAHSDRYGESLPAIARDFPDTAFAWGAAKDTFGLDNVSAYTAASDQGGYVLGALAATMCDKIGVVGPTTGDEALLYIEGFQLGAEDNGAVVDVAYLNSSSGAGLVAEVTSGLVVNGAECLTGTGQFSADAIGVAEQQGLLWFGTQVNQLEAVADGVVLASQVYRWEAVLQDLVDDVAAGSLGRHIYGIDLDNGGLTIEFGALEVSNEMRARVSDTIAAVTTGDAETVIDD